MNANEKEAYVRERWDSVGALQKSGEPYICYQPTEHKVTRIRFANWQAAYDFTLQREKEIADKREEIDVITSVIEENDPTIGMVHVFERILVTLQAQLAELQKGMKG